MDYLILILIVAFNFAIYRLVFGAFTRLSLFHVFFIAYTVSILIGLPALSNETSYYNTYYLAATSTPLLFFFGGVISRFIPSYSINKPQSYRDLDAVLNRNIPFASVMAIGFATIYVLDVGLNKSGLMFALSNPGDSVVAMELRMESLKSNISPVITRLYGYARAMFFPMLCCLALVAFLKRETGWPTLVVLLFVSSFYCLYSAAKAPLFYLFLAMALTYYWYKREFERSAAVLGYAIKVAVVMLLGLLISALLYPLLHGVGSGEALMYAFEQVNERVFEVPGSVALKYFEVFGREVDFFGLKSSRFLALLTGDTPIAVDQFLYSYFYANQFSDTGLMNAAFFAAYYGSFGFTGMAIGVVLSGILVGIVDNYLRKLPVVGLTLACRAICSLAVMQLVLTDLTAVLLGRGLIFIPVLTVFSVFFYSKVVSRR